MPDLLLRLWRWAHTPAGTKLVRYSTVSLISTAVSFFVLFMVYGVGQLWSEVPSAVFANSIATFPSYWLNRNWAWGKTGRSHLWKEVLPFWTIAAVGIAFSILWADLAGHIGHHYGFHHAAKTALVLAANVTSFGVFWVLKLLIFNRLFHVPALIEEIEEHLQLEEHPEGADGNEEHVRLEERPEGAAIR